MSNELLSAFNDGTSQAERLIAALMPGAVAVDDKDMAGLLLLITRLASRFNYYNFNDEPEGDWEQFFTSDINILMNLISRSPGKERAEQYEHLKILLSKAERTAEIRLYFDRLLGVADKTGRDLLRFLEEMTRAGRAEEDGLDLSLIMNSTRQAADALKALGQEGMGAADEKIYEKTAAAVAKTDEIFKTFRQNYEQLLNAAKYYLRTHPLLRQRYPPHLTLLVAFLDLYKHLQEKINGLTGKHLNLYYRDLLGIAPKAATPGRAYVLFEPDVNIKTLVLNAGEELTAALKGTAENLVYKLQDELVVTPAAISELKTVFISANPVFSNNRNMQDVHDSGVYQADHPVTEPTSFLKEHIRPLPWPVLGEDQAALPAEAQSMQEARIGIIVGSPVLFLPGGRRTISLRFYFTTASFASFNDYIRTFAGLSKKSREASRIELLSQAFVIDYTGPAGWGKIKRYRVAEKEENCLEVRLELSASEEGIITFDPALHGEGYELKLPLLRLLLNSGATHHPFSFFKDLEIERITVKAEVKGFSSVKLQNNTGTVSNANPFQLFGPQPPPGAFLDIKNSNIFNRFTTGFCLRLDWLDLPVEAGGFETYYEAYNTGIKNDSFTIGISALTEGKFKPETEDQQVFRLFETRSNGAGKKLLGSTEIDPVNFKKLTFTNDPLLEEESLRQEMVFTDGAVRLTLLSPPEAFGHRLFLQVFPETAMHNSKRFLKKLPLPNQPYIPVVRSISIDYTLEHTEVFKENSSGEEMECLALIHQYPFGHHRIYPENDRNIFRFMPSFGHAANLFIGLQDLQAGQELSLLFRLTESGYHHTAHTPLYVTWSYLVRNQWVPLDDKEVIYDTTHNFINTGIVRLKIPGQNGTGNTIMPAGLCWLRASVPGSVPVKSKVMAVHTNAAVAVRSMGEKEGTTAGFVLPPGSLKGFVRKIRGIKQVWQLFPSFGEREKEQDEHYYIRVSERLRHKKRPLTTRDIEQFILEAFPEVLLVKCIGAGMNDLPALPGVSLRLVLIPRQTENEPFPDEQPQVDLSTLFRVKSFLAELISPFVGLEVGNPVYEKVKVVCRVKFIDKKTADYGFYLRQLNEDIRRYVCPWLYSSGEDIKIGRKIYITDLLTYIRNLPYVSYITGFSVLHFFRVKDPVTGETHNNMTDSAQDRITYIGGSAPESVLVPSARHLITVLPAQEFHEPHPLGIGSLILGEELADAEGTAPPTPPAPTSPSLPPEDREEEEDRFNLIIHYKD